MNEVSTWASLLEKSPFIAIIIALGIIVVYLFRSRDKLQAKYTSDLVQAAQALQELTAEYLKQSFSDSASWQDRFKGLETDLSKQVSEVAGVTKRTENKLEDLRVAMKELTDALRADIKDSEQRGKEHVAQKLEQSLFKIEAALSRLTSRS